MRRFLFVLIVLMCLTGCERASSEVVLRDVSGLESSDGNTVSRADADASAELSVSDPETPAREAVPSQIVVYVCGAVRNPGVYELSEGARINDAVTAAGGFDEEADRDYVNLAAVLKDGMKLKIPTVSETAPLSSAESSGLTQSLDLPDSYDIALDGASHSEETGSDLVNINTASKEQLMTLPGIGDKVAARIVEYRDKNGSFSKKEDIMKISGIKDKLFSRIKDKITV